MSGWILGVTFTETGERVVPPHVCEKPDVRTNIVTGTAWLYGGPNWPDSEREVKDGEVWRCPEGHAWRHGVRRLGGGCGFEGSWSRMEQLDAF